MYGVLQVLSSNLNIRVKVYSSIFENMICKNRKIINNTKKH